MSAIDTASVSRSELAAALGLTPQHVGQLARDGTIPPGDGKRFPFGASVRAYAAHREALAKAEADAARKRDRLDRARLRKMEREEAKAAADLIPLADVLSAFDRITRLFLETIDRIPARVAPLGFDHARTAAIVREVRAGLEARFAEVRRELVTGEDAP